MVLVALVFLGVSSKRLATYNSEMALWQEVLQYQPNNLIAHNNVGLILTNAGRLPEAIQELQATLAIKPDYLYGLNNLGNAFSELAVCQKRSIHFNPPFVLIPIIFKPATTWALH